MNFVKGDIVYSDKYEATGVVLDTDEQTKHKEFAVLCRFNDKGNTLAWVGEREIVKK